jgi:hypothetical protein
MALDDTLRLIRLETDEKVGLTIKLPKNLKARFEQMCRMENASMNLMISALVSTAVDEYESKKEIQ